MGLVHLLLTFCLFCWTPYCLYSLTCVFMSFPNCPRANSTGLQENIKRLVFLLSKIVGKKRVKS